MAFTVHFSRKAESEIATLDKSIAKGILDKIEWLAENADVVLHHRLHGVEFGRFCRLRVGDYRIIYEIDRKKQRLFVHRVTHRREIYR